MFKPFVTTHNDCYMLCYRVVDGRARLLKSDGSKFSGTPAAYTLPIVKTFDTKAFNGNSYFKCKLGVVSCSSGNLIKDPNILALFD